MGRTTGRLGYIRPTRIQAGYSPRHRRCIADTSMLHHLRNLRRAQVSLSADYGPAKASGAWGNTTAPAGAAGRFTGLLAGRSSRCRCRIRRRSRTFQGLRACQEQRTSLTPPLDHSVFRGTTGRADLPTNYAGVHRCTRTSRPRDLLGAGQRVSPMLGIRS